MNPARSALLALLLGLSTAASADSDETCAQLAKKPVPTADAGKAASGCDPQALYYGEHGDGVGADPVAARRCAYAQRTGEKSEDPFGPPAILMMVYANGAGVARNLELAKKFACEADGAPAELDLRLDHLDRMRYEDHGDTPFDVCDDITSGYMMGFCSRREADAAKHKRDQQTQALTKSWSADDRAALAALRSAADVYFDASVDNEVDMSGTARGAFAVGARESLETSFADRLARGAIATADAAALKQADAALNAAYRKVTTALKPTPEGITIGGTVTADGVKTAERAWLKYRDAWVEFGRRKYPTVSADAWRTELTRERTALLLEILGETP